MKKLLALLLALAMVFSLVACSEGGGGSSNKRNDDDDSKGTAWFDDLPEASDDDDNAKDEEADKEEDEDKIEDEDTDVDVLPSPSEPSYPIITPPSSETVMTHSEYVAADQYAPVEIEAYVQATQSWWNNQIVIYAQDYDGGYFAYNIPCTEAQAAKLIPGTKINIKGYKTFYAGMPEIDSNDAVLTILEGADTYIAAATDLTHMLGQQALSEKAGMLAAFKGLTIVAINYRNGDPGDDIYVDVALDGNTYSFCVERYLTDPDTEIYQAFAALKPGDMVDIEGFVYWYDADGDASGDGINTHITSVTQIG